MKPMKLDSLQKFIEAEMTDRCTITRDAAGTADDTFDETVGTYTEAGRVTVYRGPCFLSTQGWQPRTQVEGGQPVIESAFKLVLPKGAKLVKVRDQITMNSSLRNPHLVGQQFRAEDRIESSHSVSQNVLVMRLGGLAPL